MDTYKITKDQARRFLLVKQGLLGNYRFRGKEGILEFIRQAGCVQFDPIDVCGKNAELVLQSRVEGFTKDMLYELLYEDRRLLDYFDKNLAIIRTEDWKYFERIREANRNSGRGREEVDRVAETIKDIIAEKGPVCSKDLMMKEKVDWYWNSTNLSRAALETLYFRGDLIIHHKKGTNKYYALAKDYLPQEVLKAPDPCPEELEHLKWRVLRRISTVGLLWNKPSDAWLYIWNLKAEERNAVFTSLLEEKKILKVEVEGIKDILYCLTEDEMLLLKVLQTEGSAGLQEETDRKAREDSQTEVNRQVKSFRGRTELIAALDNMLWDRKLIKALFDFDYKWEIYTPAEQRKYGYYVLPLLYGERFIGRAELLCDRKADTLIVKNLWFEEGIKVGVKLKKEIQRCFERFQSFHGLKYLNYTGK